MKPQIKEVQTLKELRTFIRFPVKLYRDNPTWVPAMFNDEYNTLRRDKNPAFEHCEARYWLAYQDGQVVGRVAAILNHLHLKKWRQNFMRFGWFDFIDDIDVSAALLGQVESWAREMGMNAVHGPLGFTDLDREGMLVEGFDELATLTANSNYPYYPQHMDRLGYVKDTDWLEYEIQVPPQPDPDIAKLSEIVLKRNNLRLLKLKHKKELLPYAIKLFNLLDEEYSHLYGTVPLTERQKQSYTQQYFSFVELDFVPMVVDEKDDLVAFGVALPSLSKALQKCRGELFPFGFIYLLQALKKNDRGDLYLIAVKSEYQGRGLNAVMIHQINQVFNRYGITKVESNPELETNQAVQAQWKYFEKRQHKRRRCYLKTILA